ncbi:MAG: hypothetical protein ACFBQW_07205 [Sphingomonadaceae bacterium]
MNPLAGLSSRLLAGLAALALIAAALFYVADLRGDLRTLRGQAGAVREALRVAAENPGLEWKDASRQALELGQSLRALRIGLESCNGALARLGEEDGKRRAAAEQALAKARRDARQREEVIERLKASAARQNGGKACLPSETVRELWP